MFEEAQQKGKEVLIEKLPEAREAQGWLKVCTILSFYWLLRAKHIDDQSTVYDHVLRETIRCGGDTDTNACIVGGMIGALIGFKRLNQDYVGKVFQFDCTKMVSSPSKNTQRPEFLSVKIYGAPLMKSVIERRSQPGDKLELVNDHDPAAD